MESRRLIILANDLSYKLEASNSLKFVVILEANPLRYSYKKVFWKYVVY